MKKEYKYSEEDKYLRAKEKLDNLKGFYYNLVSYCLVIPTLVFINFRFSPHEIWFYYPMTGWGIGIFFHALHTFGRNPFISKDWEQRKIQEFMDNDIKNK
ncbi:MAG: 2TM domain-containing protein [Flavobacteriaceae bacterium]|nr:2TM domain-containing protein [Flavobacteriaceae bacterium]